jgi:nucleoside-diphosphate-sugar epimerase
MRLLVLGGTRFLGRAVVAEALAAGWDVTTLTRGVSGAPPAGVDARTGDRTTEAGLAVLDGGRWDVCVDTSGFVPRDVLAGARRLAGRVGHYVFVSSLSVHPGWPMDPIGPDSPGHDCAADAGPDDGDYGVLKAGCERAVTEVFGAAATLVRSGLLVGPGDNTARLSWWLDRIARGGKVVAPAAPDRPMQLIDVRDLAAWMLRCGSERLAGAYAATAPPGSTTFGELLAYCRQVTGSDAVLRWVDDATLLAAGVEPWGELPLWLPPDQGPNWWNVDTAPAHARGLRCRPLRDTVADTWAVQRVAGMAPPAPRPTAAGSAPATLSPEKEAAVLAAPVSP